MITLPKVSRFPLWFFILVPKRLFENLLRALILINNEVSFILNLRMIFVPLFHDFTWVGRIMGLFYRLFRIVLGFTVLSLALLWGLITIIFWFFLPIILLLNYKGWFSAYLVLLVVMWVLSAISRPWKKVSQVDRKNKLDSFTVPSLTFLNKSSISYLFSNKDINNLLKKLELNETNFIQEIINTQSLNKERISKTAFIYATEQRASFVEIEHMFLALLVHLEDYAKLLNKFSLTFDTCKKAAYSAVSRRDKLRKVFFWQPDYEASVIGGVDRALTGRVTPFLDSVSTDLTKLAQKGLISEMFGHKETQQDVINLISGSDKPNVLIIGPPGSGKTSLVKGIAFKIVKGTKEGHLQFKRIVQIESGNLISGAKSSGEISEKVNALMEEIRGSKGIILFFDEIHNLVVASNDSGSTIFSLLEPHLAVGDIQVIGATNQENYRKYIEPNGSFSRLFSNVNIGPTSDEETLVILEDFSSSLEKEYGVEISYVALQKIIELTHKLVHERVFPDKAIDVLNRAVSSVANKTKRVNGEVVATVVSQITNVPVTSITETEADKLLNIEDELKKHVIGQDNALVQVSKALKRGRVGIRSEGKPIASFLFVGTTGVGKTETAKTLAEIYFGDPKAMIRLDMSEYQQPDSINRLIGSPDGKMAGQLTDAVRTKPFSIILLDEIEKAYSDVLLTFLQVLDDGRMTDSTGRVVDFTNAIIIATSNVGTRNIQEASSRGENFKKISEVAMKDVRDHFAPEFLNRFTGIIVYKPLSIDSVRKIAHLMLQRVRKIAEEKGVKIGFSNALIEELVKRGFSEEWGARPLARVIEDSVETYLAEKILAGEIRAGDEVELGIEVFQ